MICVSLWFKGWVFQSLIFFWRKPLGTSQLSWDVLWSQKSLCLVSSPCHAPLGHNVILFCRLITTLLCCFLGISVKDIFYNSLKSVWIIVSYSYIVPTFSWCCCLWYSTFELVSRTCFCMVSQISAPASPWDTVLPVVGRFSNLMFLSCTACFASCPCAESSLSHSLFFILCASTLFQSNSKRGDICLLLTVPFQNLFQPPFNMPSSHSSQCLHIPSLLPPPHFCQVRISPSPGNVPSF